jgi:hypothetical protein
MRWQSPKDSHKDADSRVSLKGCCESVGKWDERNFGVARASQKIFVLDGRAVGHCFFGLASGPLPLLRPSSSPPRLQLAPPPPPPPPLPPPLSS